MNATSTLVRDEVEPQVQGKLIGFELLISADEPVDRFCRILATLVNNGPVHLERVVVEGAVVYPVPTHPDGPGTRRRCRFKLRHAGSVLDDAIVQETLTAIARRYPWESLSPVRA